MSGYPRGSRSAVTQGAVIVQTGFRTVQTANTKAVGIGSKTRAAMAKVMMSPGPATAAGMSIPVAAMIKNQWVLSFYSPGSRRLAYRYGWVLQAPGIPRLVATSI